ncbi:LacI family transcriptional regulator [Microbacterium sp. W4I4]|uniref:LacI family DNA-binding transcriptional regulator n=1 Tax=Microbacterium sp. W4I4 TaxID=3042295 RepID=UPI002782F28E|nr:LacI family DNA-binding transcriptional regulator [Microbacterium sp. W4I4]MDQ0614945.1 LacI family transcriptional regulator [Microbacterium sp. W4I4]
MNDRSTLADIAAAADVSVATVSRVLNGRKGISSVKRDAIERLLDERGYERRHRTRRETGVIDFVIRGLETQWAMKLLRGAQLEATRAGVDLVVTTTSQRPPGAPDWVSHMTKRGTDGVVLVVSTLPQEAKELFAKLDVPVVMIDPLGVDTDSFPNVSATDWEAGRDATEHLLSLGHRRIGFITGPIDQTCHQDRLDGYYSALGRAGVSSDPSLVREGDSLVAGGALRGGELLDLAERPTAIISSSDEQAYGVYQAARARGLAIPDDLSVVGFDDVELCQWVTPQLTTMRQPLEGMATEATRMAIAMSRDQGVANSRVQLASDLVIRESTAPPR